MDDEKVVRTSGSGGPRKQTTGGKRHNGGRGGAAGGIFPGMPTTVNLADGEEEVAAMEASSTQERQSLAVDLAENDPFNWESYIAAYTNSTRILRLLFLAEHCPSIRIPCADQALSLIQAETANSELCLKALQLRNMGQQREPNVKAQDDAWLKQIAASNRNEEEKLEIELRNYQNNQIKESIRMANRDLGDFYRRAGHPQTAIKYYQATREFTTTGEHVLEMCLNVIEVALDQRAYSTVISSVAKAEGVLQTIISGGESAALAAGSIHTGGSKAGSVSVAARGSVPGGNVAPVRRGAPTAGGDAIGALFRAGGSSGAANGSASADLMSPGSGGGGRGSREAKAKKVIRELQDKLHVANGIASLGLRRYDAALRSLSKVDINSSEPWNHMASPADIALYTSFCAAAVLDRRELRRRLVGGGGPRSSVAEEASEAASKNAEGGTATGGGITGTLDVDPAARELVWKFHECDFKKVFRNLDYWKSRYMLDYHLSAHLADLTGRIKTHCVKDFLKPYDTLLLTDMADAFGLKEPDVLPMLIRLLEDDRIDIRIDMQKKMLYARKEKDAREKLYERAFKLSDKRIRECKGILFRQQLMSEKLIVKDQQWSDYPI